MRAAVHGSFYFLYLVVDVFSRKIVAWTVEDEESQDLAADMIERATREHDVPEDTLILHADNGGPMKGSTMVATLQRLGIVPSFSRPRVRTTTPTPSRSSRRSSTVPGYPRKPFASLEEARRWVEDFVRWYNSEHLYVDSVRSSFDLVIDVAGGRSLS
jgi:transposase InsO family protein